MPLQQLCSSSGGKRIFSSDTPFIPPTIQTQEVYDAKLPQRPLERCSSQASTLSFSRDICRICHCEGDSETPLMAPCYCAGSLRFVHQGCLQQWVKSSDTKRCELCKFPFIMHYTVKPFRKWERLDLNSVERRKILFSVIFHIIALTCVVWSLYVLIERTSQEVQNGELEWPFWTKLIVVAIGFTGSVVFMYVQCKMYIHLCGRWRAFNRVIYIQNVPEKIILNDVEAPRAQSECQSSAEKPFLALAVITTTAGTTPVSASGNGIVNTGHGRCYATPSSPPGALWSEESSPRFLSSSFTTVDAPQHQQQPQQLCRQEEAEVLKPNSEFSSNNAAMQTFLPHDPRRRLLKEKRQWIGRRNFRKSRDKPVCTLTSRSLLPQQQAQQQAQQRPVFRNSSSASSLDSSDEETQQLDTGCRS